MSDVPIPDDLLHDIFALLPAKYACQCKALSKDWLKAISKRKFIFKNYSSEAQKKNLVALTRNGALFDVRDINNRFTPSRILISRRLGRLGGTCDGLCVLADVWGNILIVNPLMANKVLTIHRSDLSLPQQTSYFDYSIYKVEASGEYKVVVMSARVPPLRRSASYTHGITVDVYSTVSRSWKRCPQNEFTAAPIIYHLSSMIGPEVYFVTNNVEGISEDPQLISFDVEHELVHFVQTPPGMTAEKLRGASVTCIDGKLSVLTGEGINQEVWIESIRRGGIDAWTSIHLRNFDSPAGNHPLSLLRPNLLLFISDTGILSVYDADDGSVAMVEPFLPLNRVSEAGFYYESIIDPTALPIDE